MVYITRTNIRDQLVSHLNKHLDQFIMKGVMGLSLNGGLSRGYGDHLSEVDVTVYLSPKAYGDFERGQLDLPEGICIIEGQVYDMKILNYQTELERDFSVETELWDLSYAEILYDPKNKLHQLFKNKLKRSVEISDAAGYLFSLWWHYRLAVDIWLYRQDAMQGHFLLNEAAKELIKSLYIINKVYVPHEKWLVHFIKSLDWLPESFSLEGLLSIGDGGLESLEKRQSYFHDLYQAIEEKLGCDLNKQLAVDRILSILSRSEYSLEEFDQAYGLRRLHTDPYRLFLTVEKYLVKVHLNDLKALDSKALYDWHYDIVKTVLKTL